MTRDEFIDGYMERSGISREFRTEDGFRWPGMESRYTHHALPCNCGEGVCDGWAMISEDCIDEHIRQTERMARAGQS
jgi:hypothetical protein